MKSWIDAVKRCCSSSKLAFSETCNKGRQAGFDILHYNGVLLKKTAVGANAFYCRWDNDEGEYILLASKSNPVAYEGLQDSLEEVFDSLLGNKENAVLYAARYIVIDDLQGLEVCGEGPLNGKDTVFYGVYLTDGVEGYFMAGFGSAKAEIVFDELCGAARHFYRKPSPATILKGKSGSPFVNALRTFAADLLPDIQLDWNILNLTFHVEEGKVLSKPSIIILNKSEARFMEDKGLYDSNKDMTEMVSAFLEQMPYVNDITGFTVTNFKDGRYGLTYYPADEEHAGDDTGEESPRQSHAKNWGTRKYTGDTSKEESRKDYSDLDAILETLTSVMVKMFPKTWTHGQGLITLDDEEILPLILSSCGGKFENVDIKKSAKKINSILEDLGRVLEKYYPGWNSYVFCFGKTNEGKPDLENIRDEAFNFDVFMDAETMDIGDFDDDDVQMFPEDYLMPFADLFYEELNGETCIAYVTFKVALGEDGLFVVEPATAGTTDGVARVKSFNSVLPKISSVAQDIFEDFKDSNTISVTIFPERKFGFYLEWTEPVVDINRANLTSVLKDRSLLSYEEKLTPLLRDELLGIIYEVEVESSLSSGFSKIGGSPDLPQNFEYPMNDAGTPYEFVAQINLEEVAPFDRENLLPKQGVLSFFYDKATDSGKVLYLKDDNLEMVIMPEGSTVEEYLPARIRFIPSLSLPIFGQGEMDDTFFDSEEDFEKYLDISEFEGKVKMFGYADAADERDVEKESQKPLKLLLQVPSMEETGMKWKGDVFSGSSLYFWIDEEDLKNQNFHKSFCVLQTII